jgi:TPR repeat protein
MLSTAPTTFFSYCRQDKEFATRLAEDLKASGANVWMDRLDIAPGQEWDDAVEEAVSQCPRMLLLLSSASVQSRNVRNEVAYALDEKKTIIPVLYQDCTIPLQLRRIQHIDFRTDYADGLKTLLKVLGAEQQAQPQATSVASVSAIEGHPARTDKVVHAIEPPRLEYGRDQREEAQPAVTPARWEQGYSNSSEQTPPKGLSLKSIAAAACGILIVAFVIYFVVRPQRRTASNVPTEVLPNTSNLSPSSGGLSGSTDSKTAEKQRADDPIGVDKITGNKGTASEIAASNSAPVERHKTDTAPASPATIAGYRQAAEAGDPQGMYNLAVAYELGEGVEWNPGQEIYWLAKVSRLETVKRWCCWASITGTDLG